ncbi:hypothetical protein [Treponema primitia]|uniref:hypothetical protein n=1 Tax=Treponema primitia TaxID=88058 RepID=UPI00025557D8|nr:hypothetical protein [Treponema primitia]
MRSLREKKQDFLRKKANELYASLDHTNDSIDDIYAAINGPGLGLSGFSTVKLENRFTYRKDYDFYSVKNDRGNGLNLEFYTKMIRGILPEQRLAVNFEIFNIQWGWHIYKTGFIHLFLNRLESIEGEYLEFAERAEKEEKILQISRDSITTWLEAIFKDTPYTYHTEKDDDKIKLKVDLKNNKCLELPIYYKNFQTTMPGLLGEIRVHEDT